MQEFNRGKLGVLKEIYSILIKMQLEDGITEREWNMLNDIMDELDILQGDIEAEGK